MKRRYSSLLISGLAAVAGEYGFTNFSLKEVDSSAAPPTNAPPAEPSK